MNDPKLTLKGLLEEKWSEPTVSPLVTTDWYDTEEEMPQITITHAATRYRIPALSDDLGSADRRISSTYLVDVWCKGDQSKRYLMVREVDRILHENCDSPGGGIEFIEPQEWVDLDEPTSPRIYRSRGRVETTYYG